MRYSAKLIFQYRVMVKGNPGKRRLCEDRIVLIDAGDAESAYEEAIIKGKKAEHDYLNSEENRVYFEFIGISDLLHLGAECESDEVWYDIRERLLPKENKKKIIPTKRQLLKSRSIE